MKHPIHSIIKYNTNDGSIFDRGYCVVVKRTSRGRILLISSYLHLRVNSFKVTCNKTTLSSDVFSLLTDIFVI